MITEIKQWIILYGRHANLKYHSLMDNFLQFIDTITKRLSRTEVYWLSLYGPRSTPALDRDRVKMADFVHKRILLSYFL